MTPEQECLLRIARALLDSAVKALEPAFPEESLDVCQPFLRAMDEVDKRLKEVADAGPR